MATTRDNFRHLQVPLAIAAMLMLINGGTVAVMLKWNERAKQENVQAQQKRTEAEGRLARAQEEEREIRLNILQYRELADGGVIGDENRLDWIERLAAVKAARRLYDIQYEIATQQKLDNTASGAEILVSKMKISLPLLHENDLFNLIDDLHAAKRGYFQVKQCSISRSAALDRRVLAATLSASCDLEFYTIRERAAAKAVGS